ncbi:MAG: outer membrane receptor for ferrienterochelin and colicins [Paraglaciecola sp.]|jgi:outer membrane receptor for ferrienterochelin and colicins
MNTNTPSTRNKKLLAVSISLLLSTNTMAEESDVDTQSPDMEVVVVTASGYESTIADAPASISIVDFAQIRQQPVKDLVDVLKNLPGVSNHTTQGGRNGIIIRGLDEDYVLRLVDGKRVSSGTGIWRRNNFDNTSVPLALVERVEVIRGPMSALYGSDAVGGVVNVITRKPTDEWLNVLDFEQGLMQQGEEGDRFRVSYLGSGKLNKDLGITFSAEHSEQDAWFYDPVGLVKSDIQEYTVIEPRESTKFSTTLDWQLAENQTLAFNLAHDDDEILLSDFGNYTRTQHIDRWTYELTHTADWQWGRSQITVNQSNAQMEDFNSRYIDLAETERDEQYLEPDEIYTTLRAVSYFDLDNHTVTAGVEYLDTEIKDDIQYPVNGSDSLGLTSVFLQDQIALNDNLTATLGIRAEDAEIYGFHLSPRAYLVYDLSNGITLKGGVGSAFRAPTLFEASANFESISCGGDCFIYGNPELNEETSVSTEISLLVNRKTWNSSLTIYNNEVDELIEVGYYTGDHPLAGNTAYFNLDEATLRGVEASLWVAVNDMISIDTNYTYLDATGPDGEPLAYRPEHKANIGINVAFTDSLTAYVGANYYGEYIHYKRRDATPYEQDSYTLIDISMRYQATQELAFRAGITNATAVQPIEDSPDSDLHLQGRSVFFGAEYRF